MQECLGESRSPPTAKAITIRFFTAATNGLDCGSMALADSCVGRIARETALGAAFTNGQVVGIPMQKAPKWLSLEAFA
jgi:hypothetical protein